MSSRKAASKGRAPQGLRGRFRVIGGTWRGRRLRVPDLPGVRPTPDRVRETLFNWLAPVIEGARCLDLFAGSGALGIEALSRGAARVVFVDRSGAAIEVIRANLETVGGDTRGLVCRDALAHLREAPPEAFDVVFLDPPFREGLLDEALDRLAARGWLAPGACLYIECEKALRPIPPPGWTLARSATAGQVGYHLARPEPPDGNPQA